MEELNIFTDEEASPIVRELYVVRDRIAEKREAYRGSDRGRHYALAVIAVEDAILRVLAAEAPMVEAPRLF